MTDVVVEYLGALQAERGASRNTLSAYRRDLTDFTQFLDAQHRSLRRAGPDDIVGTGATKTAMLSVEELGEVGEIAAVGAESISGGPPLCLEGTEILDDHI